MVIVNLWDQYIFTNITDPKIPNILKTCYVNYIPHGSQYQTKSIYYLSSISDKDDTLHKKWSFPLTIPSENVTESAVSCGFGHIYWRNP